MLFVEPCTLDYQGTKFLTHLASADVLQRNCGSTQRDNPATIHPSQLSHFTYLMNNAGSTL